MPGSRSKAAHLKAEVFDLFAQGVSSGDILHSYTEIPRRTVFDWLKEYRTSANPVREKISNLHPKVDSASNLIALEGHGELSDFLLARRYYRQVIQNKYEHPSMRMKAADGLTKLCLLRQQLPKHILREDETGEVPETDTSRPDYSKMSPDELAKLYQQEIEQSA